ncbi:ciliogenesis-associated TTC17-interacting protein isoform X2 [Manis pentadactyla]|uniref:ciliogenesis-associated TTC17-interacting protein isoform X2 n=1 Tax=Manis pentadactyla TaxID=143292 RepID=UPI00255CDA1A|nr:ciliogenesis-associated TTC17-interacting protein isoform X2 [Manis pentadactyla]
MSSKVQFTGPRAKDHGPPAQESLPPPVANAEAIHFLSSLEQNELQMLFFSETLAVVTDTGEPQGELTIEVQRGKYKDECGVMSHCLLVHAFSRSFVDKMLCGNSLLDIWPRESRWAPRGTAWSPRCPSRGRQMRVSLARYLRRSPWCGRRTWNSTPSSWTERRSSVSATRTTCGTTPRPKRSSPTSCSSCCCASRPTCSPSPPSTSVPSRGAARRLPPRSPPAGPARRSRGPAPARARRPPGAPGRGRGRGGAGLEHGRDAPWRRAVRAAVLMEINGALQTPSAVGTGTFLGQTRVLAKRQEPLTAFNERI